MASASTTSGSTPPQGLANNLVKISENLQRCWNVLDIDKCPPEKPQPKFFSAVDPKQHLAYECKTPLQTILNELKTIEDKSTELLSIAQQSVREQETLKMLQQRLANDRATFVKDCTEYSAKVNKERALLDKERTQERTQLDQKHAQLDQERAQLVQERAQLGQERAQLAQERAQLAQERAQLVQESKQLEQQRTELDQERAQINHERAQLEMAVQKMELGQREQELRSTEDDKMEQLINAELILMSVSIPETQRIIATADDQPANPAPVDYDSLAAAASQLQQSGTGVFEMPANEASQSDPQHQLEECSTCTSTPPPYTTTQSGPSHVTAAAAAPISDSLKRSTIEVSLNSVGPGGAQIGSDTMSRVLKSFQSNPKIPVAGRYKSGKTTIVRKLMGYPNAKCLQHPVYNTKGINMFTNVKANEPVFIDVEGFSQPLTNMDPYFLRELVVQFCASVSHSIILVVNHIDITDLQLISNVRNIAKGTIVVVHNLVSVTTIEDIQAYKQQISASLKLEPTGSFGLCTVDRNMVHYVIGNLATDKNWNIEVDPRRKETVFDEIRKIHCKGGIFNHSFQDAMRGAFSKVVTKFFEPDAAAVAAVAGPVSDHQPWEANYFSELAWHSVQTSSTTQNERAVFMVLYATYVAPMRRAFEFRDLQPHSSLTYSWLRSLSTDRESMRLHLVVDCPGFVLTGLRFLNNAIDERTILLIGTQHVYGRMALPVRELIKSPLPLVQRLSDVRETLFSRQYDHDGSVILSFVPNVQSPADLEAVKSVFRGLHEWNKLDHRILSCPNCTMTEGQEPDCCECKACAVAFKDSKM